MLVLINKNKDFVQSLTTMNIFEDNFEAIQDELDEVEEFFKENGETEGEYLQSDQYINTTNTLIVY